MTPLLFLLLSPNAHAADPSSFVSPGPLSEHHAEVNGISQCMACHSLGVGVDPGKCLECHEPVAAQIETGVGFHSDKAEACESCHPDHQGAKFEMVAQIEEQGFDHSITGFDLDGAHGRAECEECHDDGGWTGLQTTCDSCHDEPHGAENSSRTLLMDCESCHGVVDWEALPLLTSVFDHTSSTHTDFLLEGQHVDVGCEECHAEWHFVPVESDACTDCHEDIHHSQFSPRTCEDCHSVDIAAFALRNYDHDKTEYPLHGQHQGVACEDCHGDGESATYVDLPHNRCDTCHADPHEGQFKPRDCDACHTLSLANFAMPEIDHDETNFPLNGAHKDVTCDDCHGSGPTATFAGLPFDDCATCHDDFHEGQFQPDRCDSCHLDGTWETETFDHSRTDYPLTGAHVEVACADCHEVDGVEVFEDIAHATCNDCHASDDPHEGGFPADQCAECHVTDDWAQVAYDHFAETGFALADAHDLSCTECHDQPAYNGQESTCESCHDRPDGHFPGACDECHLPTDWLTGTLGENGHDITGFPLRGMHEVTSCTECHEPGHPATSASTQCVDCHRGEDPHRNLAGNVCEDCHGSFDWNRVRFAHAATGFPLRGNHKLATCNDCHATGFAGTPQECFQCHRSERPNDAVHTGAAGIECATCHRPYDWERVRPNPHGNF